MHSELKVRNALGPKVVEPLTVGEDWSVDWKQVKGKRFGAGTSALIKATLQGGDNVGISSIRNCNRNGLLGGGESSENDFQDDVQGGGCHATRPD